MKDRIVRLSIAQYQHARSRRLEVPWRIVTVSRLFGMQSLGSYLILYLRPFPNSFRCEDEENICREGASPDGGEQYSNLTSEWHSLCDQRTMVTTPMTSSLTATYSPQNCLVAESSCEAALDSLTSCYVSYSTRPSAF